MQSVSSSVRCRAPVRSVSTRAPLRLAVMAKPAPTATSSSTGAIAFQKYQGLGNDFILVSVHMPGAEGHGGVLLEELT